jgi:putative transposase
VIQRGNNRQSVFFAETDYRYYRDTLQQAAARYDCAIHAYVLMTNHVHLLVTPHAENGLSRMMQGVGRRYVRYINGVYRRSGTLWEGRFKAALVDSERYLLTCMRYIELNPVRAGMVESPALYRWSSYRVNALGATSELITAHSLYRALGQSDEECRKAYSALFEAVMDGQALDRIRSATQSGEIIGNQRFRDEIARAMRRRVEKMAHGGDRKSKSFRKQKKSSALTR